MAATSFFGGAFFGGEFFNTASADTTKTGTGGIDPAKRSIFKPTGLLHLPKKKGKSLRKEVSDRVDESAQIQAEIAGRLAREFGEETAAIEARPPVVEMSLKEVELEIGTLLSKKLRTQEDEVLLLLLMVAVAV